VFGLGDELFLQAATTGFWVFLAPEFLAMGKSIVPYHSAATKEPS
jgi:hypothetical protein